MAAATQTQPLLHQPEVTRWSFGSRLAFRFCSAYFGMFCLMTQVFGGLFPIPGFDAPDLSVLWPMRQIVFWVAAHVFGAKQPLSYTPTGSGDKAFDWVLAFCLLLFAVAASLVWSILDRKRPNYVALHKWFRLFLRFALASEMILYGMAKVVPLQMPFPHLTRLVEPFGNFSPMGVLWYSIGASPAYETFTGCAEMLGGILLLTPRTTMFGAMVCLADAVQIFTLNMTYDVPVKLFSFHLILMSSFLLAPELSRLVRFFFLNRPTGPSAQPELFRTRRANRIALAAQLVFGIFLVSMNAYGSWRGWHTYGGGSPKPALYGIWNVEQMSIDGQQRSPLLTDYGRWRRAIFDVRNRLAFQRMDDSVASYSAAIDSGAKTIALTKGGDKNWKAGFTFERAARDRLTLDGTMDGHKVHMQLQLVERDKYLLVNRGFHWIQEFPFNR